MMQGDLVTRKSYGRDLIFRILAFQGDRVILKGLDVRLIADAPASDLERVVNPDRNELHRTAEQKTMEWRKSMAKPVSVYRTMEGPSPDTSISKPESQHYFDVPGKVLHLDGDPEFLRKSMAIYHELRIPAEGHFLQEETMPEALYRLLPQSRPDIVVITGHDGLIKHRKNEPYQLSSYKNSQHFVNAVRIARGYEKNRDMLTVVAGACQSYFEALLNAGANFASSPARILIHALDPVYIACKAAYTPVRENIDLYNVISRTMSGMDGVGGIESTGSYRVGLPKRR